jgi:transposase-like protein
MEPLEPPPATPRGLTEPAQAEPVRCPWCNSTEVERIGAWASQLLTEQYMCRACHSPFEWIRKR